MLWAGLTVVCMLVIDMESYFRLYEDHVSILIEVKHYLKNKAFILLKHSVAINITKSYR